MKRALLAGLALLIAGACKKPEPPPLYQAVPVVRRDIIVSAEAAGAVEAITVVNVKSRASGTILRMPAQTGLHVRSGDTLVIVDRRDPTNAWNQAQAELAVARANVENAQSNKQRIETMFASQLASAQEHEAANLTYSTAQAQLVRAQIQLQQAQDALSDCTVLSSVNGVILTKGVDVGTVIASAVNQVSGGTTLLTMANLDTVQLRVQVDETDIGKIQPGLQADITVDAFPNRPFHGQVLKIEPQSTVNNNVTMFPVLIWIPNPDGVLLPGMNANVQIHVAQTTNVLAIPNAALRTTRDVASAATVLGLDPANVQRQLAQADSQAGRTNSLAGQTPESGQRNSGNSAQNQAPQPAPAPAPAAAAAPAATPAPNTQNPAPGFQRPPLPSWASQDQVDAIRAKRRGGETLTPAESTLSARLRDYYQQQGMGRPGQGGNGGNTAPATSQQPSATSQSDAAQSSGASMDEIRAAFMKRQSGQALSAHEQDILRQAAQRMGQGGGRGMNRPNNNFMFGGSYIVFVKRNGQPAPVRIRTGVTDLDYSEVKSGLTERDTVLLLPSASLVQSQQDMKDRFQRMTGGGGVPGMAQQTARPTTQAQPTAPRN
jgi:HlyD family secretion protein